MRSFCTLDRLWNEKIPELFHTAFVMRCVSMQVNGHRFGFGLATDLLPLSCTKTPCVKLPV